MYEKDLAEIQHALFGDFAKRAAPGLLRLLREAKIDRGVVVDLGCGSGIWLRELARAGFETVGVDLSPDLLRIARATAPRAALHRASVHDFDLPECDAVTAIGEVLSYHPAPDRAKPSLLPLFRKVSAALRPGGLFVFDVLVASRQRPPRTLTFRLDDSCAVLAEAVEESGHARLTRNITSFRRIGRHYRRSDERHVLSVADPTAVAEWLRSAGFSVRTLRRYGRFDLLPGRVAFRARK